MQQTRLRFDARVGTLVACILVAVAASSPVVAQAVRVPGTKVSLEPPRGFSLAQRFPGFERAELQASIMVTEMPAPVSQMKKAMTKEAWASQGMRLIASTNEKVDAREALLLHVAQKAADTQFPKWILVLGDHKSTVMIMGTFPESASQELSTAMRRSVLSASWNSDSVGDPFEGLMFRVTPSPKLKIAGRVSNLLMLTPSGSTGPFGPEEPIYIVGSSLSPSRIVDLRSFSETRAKLTAQTKDVANLRGRALKLDGLEAYELVADAKDAQSGTALRLYQVIAPEGGGYFIIQALVGAERSAEMVAEFRRITATFRRTSSGGAEDARQQRRPSQP